MNSKDELDKLIEKNGENWLDVALKLQKDKEYQKRVKELKNNIDKLTK